MTLINKVGVSHIHFSTILSHTLGTRIYMSDFVYNCEHTRETAWTTTIYTKTSQVTVGQLHCFEMIPLGTFSAFDAPDLRTSHLVTAGNHFPSKRLNFKPFHSEPSNTFVEKHLRRETPSTSKATKFSLGRNSLSTLPSSDGHFDRPNWSKTSFSFNGWH